jgi:hypothetical protein
MDFLGLPEELKDEVRLLPTPSFIFNMEEIKNFNFACLNKDLNN